MGARHSTTACQSTPTPTDAGSPSAFEPGGTGDPPLVPENAAAPIVPAKPMPRLQRSETFEEKLYRKFKAEPLVPIGCLTTAFFLGSGIKSFYNHNPAKSQTMMRLRVGSQFATILIFIGYAGWNSFTFEFAPGMAVPSEQGYGAAGGGGGTGGGGQE